MSAPWLTKLFGNEQAACGCAPCQVARGIERPVTTRFRKTLLTGPTGTPTVAVQAVRVRGTVVARCAGCNMLYESELLQQCPDCRERFCPYCDRHYHGCGAMRSRMVPAAAPARRGRARLAA